MEGLKPLDYLILSELMKNAKISDRQVARKLKVSQPTVTRRRAQLEKKLSLNYTTVPDWSKLGFQIIAFTFAKWKHRTFPDERTSEAKAFASRHPNMLFMSTGQGLGSDRVGLSIHKNYRDYNKFMEQIRQEWGQYTENLNSFIISIGGNTIIRPLTLRHLADRLRPKAGPTAR